MKNDNAQHTPATAEQIAEIEKRHDEDEDRSPEYCDRWRDIDQVNVSFREAHADRATLLTAYHAQAARIAELEKALEPRSTFPLDDAQVVMRDYDVGTPEYRCAEFVWINRPAPEAAQGKPWDVDALVNTLRLCNRDCLNVHETARKIAATFAQPVALTEEAPTFSGMKLLVNERLPSGTFEFHHTDGRVDVFKVEGDRLTRTTPEKRDE